MTAIICAIHIITLHFCISLGHRNSNSFDFELSAIFAVHTQSSQSHDQSGSFIHVVKLAKKLITLLNFVLR